jgi:DnaK suppressor protein
MPKTTAAKTNSKSKTQPNQSKELLEQRARLLAEGRSTSTTAVVARRDEPNDYGDMSEQSHEEWLFLNRNRATNDQLKQINEALQRINEGTYGVCAECEKPISPKRLQAVPWAKYCVACEEQRGNWTN